MSCIIDAVEGCPGRGSSAEMSGIIVGFSLSSLTNEMRVHGGGRLASLILSAACYRTNPNFKLALLQLVCQFLMHHSINHQLVLKQRFSIPVLAPPLCIFRMLLLCFRCLFYSNVSALRSVHHRIFRHDSSSKLNVYTPFKVHWSVRDVN